MDIIIKIFELISRATKMNENVKRINREHDLLSAEIKQMDKRITRLEIYFETIEKNNRAHSHLKEII